MKGNQMDNINTEEIMAQIKQEIKEQELTSDMLSFEDIPYRKPAQNGSADETMAWLDSHHYVQPYKQLSGNPVSVFGKKTVRKLTKFYIEPIASEQSDINANVVDMLRYLTAENKRLADRVEALENDLRALRRELSGEDI
jgi:hypothetical protein